MNGHGWMFLRRYFGDRSGGAAAEFALILPMLFVLLFGVIGVGRALWLQNALNISVEQTARCVSIDANNCGTASNAKAYAAAVSGANFDAAVFSVSAAACGNQVQANFPIQINTIYAIYTIALTAQSCYPR